MKKTLFIITIILLILTSSFGLISCNSSQHDYTQDAIKINIAVPDGAPALAIAKMMYDNAQLAGYDISYSIITGGATAITAAVNKNEANILIAPTNLGAILYNRLQGNKEVKLIANEFNSLLYIIGKDQSIVELEDLKGKTLFVIGQGATPDLTIQHILNQKSIPFEFTNTPSLDKIGIMYENDATAVLPRIKQGQIDFAILGEPAVTKAINEFGCFELFSLNNLWNDATNSSNGFPQASFFGIGDVLKPEHKELIDWFIQQSIENITWVKENPTLAQETLEAAGWQTPVSLNTELINRCNMEFISAQEAKIAINNYLSVLYEMKSVSVGGTLPGDGFYYNG